MTVNIVMTGVDLSGRSCWVEQAVIVHDQYARTKLEHYNLTVGTSRNVIAQADTAEELTEWAKANGAKRVEVLT